MLREAGREIGLLRQVARCFSDYRQPERIEHRLECSGVVGNGEAFAVKRMERKREVATNKLAPGSKGAILRRHLLEWVPIPELSDKPGFQPTAFCRWQKECFENGEAACSAESATQPFRST